jgi:hypothetical protein
MGKAGKGIHSSSVSNKAEVLLESFFRYASDRENLMVLPEV